MNTFRRAPQLAISITLAVVVIACTPSPGPGGGGGTRSLDDLIRLCAINAACGRSPSGSFPGYCVNERLAGLYSTLSREATAVIEDCMLDATTCSASRACYGATTATVATCTPGCQGFDSVRCDGTTESRIDCSAQGGICVATADGTDTTCASGTCVAEQQMCTGPSELRVCTSGLELQLECGFGVPCVDGSCGRPRCNMPGGVDCSAVGASCQGGQCVRTTGGGAPCTDYSPTCVDGATQEFCLLGRTQRVNCASIGLARCQNGYCLATDTSF